MSLDSYLIRGKYEQADGSEEYEARNRAMA
jgi:hypothetical protein